MGRWLRVRGETESGEVIHRRCGTPQGGVISPLLANLFLHYAFDRWIKRQFPSIWFEHYADGIVIHASSRKQACITTVLSDNEREYCGRPDNHPYELFLQLEGIEHRITKVRRPRSNGFIERLHRTLPDEHFRVQGRTKWYESLDELQTDLDSFLRYYNQERPHQGRNMKGQTPGKVFFKGLPKTKPAVSKQIKQAA